LRSLLPSWPIATEYASWGGAICSFLGTTAVDEIKQSGLEVIVGSEAKELLGKMEQVKGVLPQTDNIEGIWEVENWGEDEWTEQVLAEFAFCKALNVQFFPDSDNRRGAGYRMRPRFEWFGAGPFRQRRRHLCGSEGGENKKRGTRFGLVARIGGEGFTVLSKELLGDSSRSLARYGKAPRKEEAPDNATISRAVALKGGRGSAPQAGPDMGRLIIDAVADVYVC
jgi:hypothetical protein